MKHSAFFLLSTALLLGVSCKDSKNKPAVERPYEVPQAECQPVVRDTILTGVLGEASGMNVLQLVCENGDTLEILKEHPNGREGKVIGHIRNYTDRVTLQAQIAPKGELYLVTFLNITQLQGYWKGGNIRMGLYADSTINAQGMAYERWQVDQCKLLLTGTQKTEYGEVQRTDTATVDFLNDDSLYISIPRHSQLKFGR